ncbi:MAG TPA: protein kinase [Dermatophilaceae bacterium]|nr:protein kinase [Dermatophilaceae bacterium]
MTTVDDAEQEALAEHTVLGSYRLVQRLGEGGMGVVHLALDRQGRAVALKVLRPHIAHDPAARARLAREVDTLSRIRSPRVAPVIDADIDGERPFIVTRYVPGPALDDVVGRNGPMDAGRLHRLGAGLAEAIDVIHAADIVHRDLKPGNVLLVDDDPVLIDFGIAHVTDDIRLTLTGLVMGTPGYLAPEVVEGAPVSRATDWWGWAATLAYAASGHPPFGRGPMDAVLGRVARGEPDLSGVDPRIAPLLYAALSPRPGERPHEREVVAALERYSRGGVATDVIDLRRAPPPTASLAVAPTLAQRVAPAPQQQVAAGPALPQHQVAGGPALPQQQVAAGLALPPAPAARVPWDGAAGDPRIGRATRTGTLAALLALVVAGGSAFPAVTALAVLVGMVIARAVDRSVTSRVRRRYEKGARSSDVAVAVAASPWHLVVGAVGALFAALMPALVAVSAVFASALALVLVVGGETRPDAPLPLAVGALLGTLMAWWGPGGASLRRGTRSLVRGATPSPALTRVAVGLLLAGAAAVAAWGVARGAPTWWPLGQPPSSWGFPSVP